MPNSIQIDAELAAKIRNAIEGLRSDVRVTVDQHNANGPTWTINGSGYYSESYVLDKAEELTESIDEILAMLAPLAPEEAKAEEWRPGVGEHPTRGGGTATVQFIQRNGTLVGELSEEDGGFVATWNPNGSRYDGEGHIHDLVPPPVPAAPEVVSEPLLEGWVNVYSSGDGCCLWETEERANQYAHPGRLRCVHVREVREPGVDSKEEK